MLLKLIPANSEPTIHFSLSFSDLPPHLPTPAAWTAQLAQLMFEDLEVPATIHSLDKSAGITSLLEEVALDVGANEVRCRFVDGKIEKWGFWDGIVGIGPWKSMAGTLYGQRLVDALNGIMRDVKESTLEDDRVSREKEWEKQKLERSRSLSTATAPKGILGKVSKHKKQRSFFMQIVSCVGSIINLTSPSTANHPSLPFSRSSTSTPPVNYPASTTTSQSSSATSASPGTSPRARALRRAARSALVDTYRLFVLSEIINRLQGPSDSLDQQLVRSQEYQRKDKVAFGIWILHSMRRRALERMEQLMEEAEAEAKARGYVANVNRDLNAAFFGMEPVTTAVPLSFSDDEDDAEQPAPGLSFSTKSEKERGDSDSDETDGSSVHTPSTASHYQCYPGRPPMSRTSSTSSHSADSSSSASSDDAKVPQDAEGKDGEPTLAVAQKSLPEIPHFRPIPLAPSVSAPTPHVLQYLSTASLHEYSQLVELRSRLGNLLLFAASQARVAADEAQSRLEILAVRSRRRAWSNRALSLMARSQAGLGGSAIYGLTTPFRSSSLAKHMWTAEDSFRGSSSSSTSQFLSSTLTHHCASRDFPSYRPRLRPKIQYDIETLAVEVNDDPFEDDDDFGGITTDHVPVDLEYEMYEELIEPPTLGGSARRHVRGGGMRRFSAARPVTGKSGIGRLFPVSEEIDGEIQDHFPDEDQVLEFALHGKHLKNEKRTFMGCDEVKMDGQIDNEDCLEDPNTLDMEIGFGEFGNPVVPHNVGVNGGMCRPSISPRARTTSMMGTFVHRTKKAQSEAFHAASHQVGPELTKDSLLCQPVSAAVSTPTIRMVTPPKLQIQSQVRVKSGSPPKDGAKAKTIQMSTSPTPAIYNGVEVDLELDVQVRVGEYLPDSAMFDKRYIQESSPPLSIMLPKQQIVSPEFVAAPEEEEFTLSMDVAGDTKRRHSVRRHKYPTRPLSRHEFENNRRPKLGCIFANSQQALAPKLADVAP